MQPKVLKYLLDIESIISEIETIKVRIGTDFTVFAKDIIMQRAVERELEIIGEAVRKLIDCKLRAPTLQRNDHSSNEHYALTHLSYI